MPKQLIPVCTGSESIYLKQVTGRVDCKGGSWAELDLSTLDATFDFSAIPPEQIAGYFGAGFFVYITFWAVGRGLKSAFSLLK